MASVLGEAGNSTLNHTDRTGLFQFSNHSLAVNIILIILFTIIVIWTVLGNLTVIISIHMSKALKQSRSNYLIGNLALSDLLLGLGVLPFSAMFEVFGYWPLGRELCFYWLIIGE